jgi:pimeloyl-ACP methyl ester carboxylesterase
LEGGDPAGRPVLVFAGWGDSRLARHPDEAATAALGLRVITVDRPGVGGSDPAPGRRVADWATDVRVLADHLELERFDLFGWSGGAPHVLAVAAAMPDRVGAAGLAAAVAPLGSPSAQQSLPPRVRRQVRLALRAPVLVRLLAAGLGRRALRDPEGFGRAAYAEAAPSDRALFDDPAMLAMFTANTRETYRQGGRGLADDGLALLRPWGFDPGSVRVPVRLWHGELDQTIPAASAEAVAGLVPGATLTVLPGQGHLIGFGLWHRLLGELTA